MRRKPWNTGVSVSVEKTCVLSVHVNSDLADPEIWVCLHLQFIYIHYPLKIMFFKDNTILYDVGFFIL